MQDGTWDTSSLYDDCPPFNLEEAEAHYAVIRAQREESSK